MKRTKPFTREESIEFAKERLVLSPRHTETIEWIPVNEELPDTLEPVFVKFFHHRKDTVRIGIGMWAEIDPERPDLWNRWVHTHARVREGRWVFTNNSASHHVTHWARAGTEEA